MKVCFISTMPAGKWGGSEVLWTAAARYALEQQHTVLISAPYSAELYPELSILKKQGASLYLRKERDESTAVERAGYKLKRALKNIPAVPAFYYELFETVRNFNPDFICVSLGGVFNIVEHHEVMWMLKQIGKPFFLVGQSNLEHRVYHRDYLERIRIIYQAARKVYFISQRNLEVAKRQLASPDFKNYEVLKNPCRLTDRRVVEYPCDRKIHFAMVGRLSCRNKGHDVLFQVLSAEHWQQRDWVLNIYGMGDDLKYLQELAAYLGIGDKINFPGWENNVAEIWRNNHILLMPSIEEGTPLALIEAMACGRTAVVTDVGDNAALIKEGENGFVAEAPTVKLVDAALERAWNKRDEWKELGIKAHTFIENWIDPHPGKRLLDSMINCIQAGG